jgi:hypothetical protein
MEKGSGMVGEWSANSVAFVEVSIVKFSLSLSLSLSLARSLARSLGCLCGCGARAKINQTLAPNIPGSEFKGKAEVLTWEKARKAAGRVAGMQSR